MEYVKANPVGVDINIKGLQRYLYPQLKTLWGINDDTSFDSYGRAYRNQTEDGYIPEVYVGLKEYKEVLFDDKLKALSFFGVSEDVSYSDAATAQVFLIFMVNLDQIKPGVGRNDEEVRNGVQRLLTPAPYGFTMTGFATGIDTVFKEYSGWRKTQGIKYRDMHPLHCFRINFSLLYDINQC